MKKLFTLLTALAFVINADAQRLISIGGKEYKVSDIEDITYKNVRVTVGDILANHSEYSIFYEALEKTGMLETLGVRTKGKEYVVGNPTYDGTKLYHPEKCLVGYTLFAEKNEVFQREGINSFADLVAKCKEWYGNADQWYDYVRENRITISTGADYTNPFNVVNMFVAYHIIKGGMPVDRLTYEKNTRNSNWNVCFGYEPQEYYETLLPHTLMKVWQVNPKTTKNLWINRYRRNNTLTDEIGTFGSDDTHPIIFQGVGIDRNSSIEAYNGYIHSINSPLLYTQQTVASQQERMRIPMENMLSEIADNGLKYATNSEVSALCLQQNGSTDGGNRVALATDYFENLQCYNPKTLLRYCVMGGWRTMNSTQLQGPGECDFAVKLPAVPTGTYEIRIIYAPMFRGEIIQYYLGKGRDIENMEPMGLPLNAMEDPTQDGNPMGCEYIGGDDYGFASDKVMRNRGYMRAPASFARGGNNMITDKLAYDPSDIYSAARNIVGSTSCRSEWGYGTMMLRYIIGTTLIKQGDDMWLRIKGMMPATDPQGAWTFDFIELVPVSVVNNTTMHEDWY